MILDLEKDEITSIIAVLEQLPTGSNAWPLVQKIKFQFEEANKATEETPVE